jgi:hypothetical protein
MGGTRYTHRTTKGDDVSVAGNLFQIQSLTELYFLRKRIKRQIREWFDEDQLS